MILLPVELAVDSNNDGVIDDRDSAQKVIASGSGTIDKPGLIVYSNDGDTDGDGVPDWVDGIKKFSGQDGGGITGGKFQPMRVKLPDTGDLDKLEIRFVYDASDPASVSTNLDDNKYKETQPSTDPSGVPSGKLRIWTKDGSQLRDSGQVNAESAGNKGDYVPANEWIKAKDLFSAQTSGTLYLEGIHASLGDWGQDRIKMSFRINGGTETLGDQVSYTVVRAFVNVYVWRPYWYDHDTGIMTPHPLYLVGSPADAEADFAWGAFYSFDTENSYTRHSFAAAMGHLWLGAVYQGPAITVPTSSGNDEASKWAEWAGQTSIYSSKIDGAKGDWHMYDTFWGGTAFWERVDGERDKLSNDTGRVTAMLGEDGYNPTPSGGFKLADGKTAVVRHQWRIPPKAARAALEYILCRDYSSYGLDIGSTQSSPAPQNRAGPKGNSVQMSGGGCGSFVGLTLNFIGLNEHNGWWIDRQMAKGVEITQPSTVLWAVSHYIAQQVCQNTDAELHSKSQLNQWQGTRCKFIDPGTAAEWCINQTSAKTPVTLKSVKDFQ